MVKNTDTLIISFNECDDPDEELLLVGKKIFGNYNVEIVNAIQGPRARKLWDQLTAKGGDTDGSRGEL